MNPALTALSDALEHIIRQMDARRQAHQEAIARVHPEHRLCAANLVDYLAFREADRSELQERLARFGLSSLGRSEAAIRPQLLRVKAIVDRLAGKEVDLGLLSKEDPLSHGRRNLEHHTSTLFGPRPEQRHTRIMVTLPSEADEHPELIESFLRSGMNVARINCAHDDSATWRRIARHVRTAAHELDLPCRIMMDLAGPKLRTGTMPDGPRVVKVKPLRSARGEVVQTATLMLHPARTRLTTTADQVCLPILIDSFGQLPDIRQVTLTDARGKHRSLSVIAQDRDSLTLSTAATVYFEADQILTLQGEHGRLELRVAALAAMEGFLNLRVGSQLRLVADDRVATPAVLDDQGQLIEPATVACGVPEALIAPAIGHKVKLDDGRFTGEVISKDGYSLTLQITEAPPGGGKLRAEKGINFPETELPISGLTATDLEDLDTVCEIADLVALSFVNRAEDVQALRNALAERQADTLGIILKIETRQAWDRLPELLLTALQSRQVGVMIARGDLGVEVGWRQMAELQEEILWLCAAAHIPSIWATQVLDTMARTGQPTRSEVTDAAMAQRSECVMLNKGPYIHRAVRMLNRIIRTMDARQYKKSARLPPLTFRGLQSAGTPGAETSTP